ncbi:AAA family ATPase [Mesotoga sp. UBA5847]|jgi:wobble nucleotide-excising tRNase|uniref:AAA family ATPase n=1 Tax=Mesotoga sp. UBA5847 TaxID=1946859 RepID=UPI0025F498F7|nr:AAA family ATPase [Mesotoga sp. UBA5847]
MIEKILSIKNIGRFRNCKPRGDVSFRKLTLLFAENGRGKTTLCAILRSLQTGQSEFISERKTLGTTDSASVQIRLGGNTHTFGTNGWSSIHSDIVVFDSVFIHDNVYAGDHVEHEHKKNLYRVIIGPNGVQLAQRVEELDGKIRDANTDINTKKSAVSRTLLNGMTLETYLAWQPIENIEAKIQQKNTEITNRQRALDKATEIQSKALLSKIDLPAFPVGFLGTLSKQLTDVIADAEARVRRQIEDHSMGNKGETWLSQGLAFVAHDKCPFCGQNIETNELIAAYKSHFNAAYTQLKQESAGLSQRISSAIGETALNSPQQTYSSNLTLVEFWKQFAEIAVPSFDFENVRTKYSALRDLATKLAEKKQQLPTEPILPGDDFQAAHDAVTALQSSVETYNVAVNTANTIINEQKASVQQGVDINVLKSELADLEARKKRFERDVVQACKDYQDAVTEKTSLEQQKSTAKEQLDQHCQQILQTYQSSINTYLDQFNAGFRITNSRHLYTGGTPSSHYQIEINNNAVDLGDSRTQPGMPCFKTTLSSGDRSALALAFFLAALKQDAEIGNKIVVLDDPFTSQDRFRRTCTQQLIRQMADTTQQVIVLSHDPFFLKLIWEGYAPADIKTLQMCRTGDNTIISEWDIETETKSTYMKNYSMLLDFYRERKGVLLDVARSIRPFIEGMLRAHFPGHFQQNEWLGDFIVKIRNASNTDGLYHAQADLSEIEAINDYSKKYHHDQNPSADSEYLSEEELYGFVKRTLKLVGGC